MSRCQDKYTTLLDLARQAKIISGNTACFDGKIQAGIPFSGYPTGIDLSTVVNLGVVSQEDAVFSSSTATTLFDVSNSASTTYDPIFDPYSGDTWTNPLFSANTVSLNLPITTLSAQTQSVGPFWTLTQTGMTGDHVIGLQYTGYTIQYGFFNVVPFGLGYSGFTTAQQINYSAGTLDYKGPLDYIHSREDATIENKLTTKKIKITEGASASTIGFVLTQIDEEGNAAWVYNSADSGETVTYWTSGSSGNYSLKTINDSTVDATGDYAIASGFDNLASGDYSSAGGYQSSTSGDTSFIHSNTSTISNSDYASILGGINNEIYDTYAATIIGGDYGLISGTSNTLGLVGSAGSTIIGGIGAGINKSILESYGSTVIGGLRNTIQDNNWSSIIGTQTGQMANTWKSQMFPNTANNNFMAGGAQLIIDGGSYDSIVGGRTNLIRYNTTYSGLSAGNFIGGGEDNTIEGHSNSAILGGKENYIGFDDISNNAIIAGTKNSINGGGFAGIFAGSGNTIQGDIITDTDDSNTIIGGRRNIIYTGISSSIVGGQFNEIDVVRNSGIFVGTGNTIGSNYNESVILGGDNNSIEVVSGETCGCPCGFYYDSIASKCVAYEDRLSASTGYVVGAITPNLAFGDFGARFCTPNSYTDCWETGAGGQIGTNFFRVSEFFPAEDSALRFFGTGSTTTGRLNEIGVWGAGIPNGEWIGFSRCFTLPSDGQYLFALAGDNQIRATVDGEVIVENPYNGSTTDVNNFKQWWVWPIDFLAGQHNIILEGKNNGGAAGFGCEIIGPFSADTFVNPIDFNIFTAQTGVDIYTANTVFKSSDQIGVEFDTSEDMCPEGYAYDACTSSCIKGIACSNDIRPNAIVGGCSNSILDSAQYGGILGGCHNILDKTQGSVILGGRNITGTTDDTAYVPNLNIYYQPEQDDSLTQILVRHTDGTVKYRESSTLGGNFTGNTSGDCITDLYVSNIHSCSPLNINPNDEGNVYFGSTSGITIDVTNNRVGIGTTEPTQKLDVRGNILAANPTGVAKLTLSGGSVGDSIIDFDNIGVSTPYARIEGNTFGGGIAGNLEFYTYPTGGPLTKRVIFSYQGNVGIGVPNNNDIEELLHVEGGDLLVNNTSGRFFTDIENSAGPVVKMSGASDDVTRYEVNLGSDGTIALGIRGKTDVTFPGYGNQNDSFLYSSNENNGLNILSTPGTGTDDYIRFYAGKDANGTTPDLYIQGSGLTKGNVGINTETPEEKFHVEGGDFLISNTQRFYSTLGISSPGVRLSGQSDNLVSIAATTNSTPVNAGISIVSRGFTEPTFDGYGKPGDGALYSSLAQNGLNIISAPGSGTEDYIKFFAGDDADGTTANLYIHGTGSTKGFIGINTEDPTERLHIEGSMRMVDGNQQSGYVLTSDADGVGRWQSLSSSFTGNTSGDCITELWVSNIQSCSPLNINTHNQGNIYIGIDSGLPKVTLDITTPNESSITFDEESFMKYKKSQKELIIGEPEVGGKVKVEVENVDVLDVSKDKTKVIIGDFETEEGDVRIKSGNSKTLIVEDLDNIGGANLGTDMDGKLIDIPSDSRVKHLIHPLSDVVDPLEFLANVKGYQFEWKESSRIGPQGKKYYGFKVDDFRDNLISDPVGQNSQLTPSQKICNNVAKSMVRKSKTKFRTSPSSHKEEMDTMNYIDLVPFMIEGIKSLNQSIVNLNNNSSSSGSKKYVVTTQLEKNKDNVITHNLNDIDVIVQLRDSETGDMIIPKKVFDYQSNTVKIQISETKNYKIIIIG